MIRAARSPKHPSRKVGEGGSHPVVLPDHDKAELRRIHLRVMARAASEGPTRPAIGTFPYPHRTCAEWR